LTLLQLNAHPLLERHAGEFDYPTHRARDPVSFAHRYRARDDIEAIAFIAASLAFGRVAAFRPHLQRICDALGEAPAATLRQAARGAGRERDDALAAVRAASNGVYRWLGPADIDALLLALGDALAEAGSLEGLFAGKRQAGDVSLWEPLGRMLADLRQRAGAAHRGAAGRARALAFLFPSTDGDAACKRQHLFLRWMVRPPTEGVDFGLWTAVSPRELVVPCDVHVARIGHALGLCARPDPTRATAEEITRSLRLVAPEDPVRYDFALCHLGISGGCRAKYVPTVCEVCGLREACRWWGSV
jgi:uncharacterized protein (TIGR02757 family)